MRRLLPFLVAATPSVGGQAVMEGVMMRRGERLAIAVRTQAGDIAVEVRPWFSLSGHAWLKKPFVRGFPILVETLVNGIKALNWSAQKAVEEEGEGELSPWALAGTVALSIGLALGLFVVLPHAVSAGLTAIGLAGDLKSLSFHAWDGLFKLALFLGYVAAISRIPDIRRVFQYHGAEHKTIWAYESGEPLTPERAREYSRLHPRCGTTFLLFVLALSILSYAVLVPAVLGLWSPEASIARHAYVVVVKFLFMVPISAAAYEMIRVAGKYQKNIFCSLMSCPGLLMQRLTTFEPDDAQIEVAIAALKAAVGEEC